MLCHAVKGQNFHQIVLFCDGPSSSENGKMHTFAWCNTLHHIIELCFIITDNVTHTQRTRQSSVIKTYLGSTINDNILYLKLTCMQCGLSLHSCCFCDCWRWRWWWWQRWGSGRGNVRLSSKTNSQINSFKRQARCTLIIFCQCLRWLINATTVWVKTKFNNPPRRDWCVAVNNLRVLQQNFTRSHWYHRKSPSIYQVRIDCFVFANWNRQCTSLYRFDQVTLVSTFQKLLTMCYHICDCSKR